MLTLRRPPPPRTARHRRAPTLPSATAAATAATVTALREAALAVPDAGLFGAKGEARANVDAAITAAEATTPPDAAPTADLAALDGAWRVLYSSVTVTGSKRTQLGLRSGAVSVAAMTQTLNAAARTAVNEVAFTLHFLGGAPGALTLTASFDATSPTRVDITLADAALSPSALNALMGSRMDMLLSIFNPAGWLETTFVGGGLRVGRDDKGHVFVLEKV